MQNKGDRKGEKCGMREKERERERKMNLERERDS